MFAVHRRPDPDYTTVTATAAQFTITMESGAIYAVVSTTAAWVAIGDNPTAVLRADGNTYLPPNIPMYFAGPGKVSIVRDAADGHASMSGTL